MRQFQDEFPKAELLRTDPSALAALDPFPQLVSVGE